MVSDTLLDFAAENYSFDKSTLGFISDSTNQVYMFTKDGKEYALRFSSRPDIDIHQTKAEMDWLYYLAKNDIGVSLPLKAKNGELAVSTTDIGVNYIVTAFEFVNGQFWDKNDPDFWNEKIFYIWGKVMGDIHRLTKNYKLANNQDKRGDIADDIRRRLERIKACPAVYKIAQNLTNEILALPKDKDSYGLIHYDIHPWNFYIDGNKVNVFDFDDSLYGWFALDIGIALYHGLWWGRKNDTGNDFTNEIISSFLRGYLSANPLSDFWLSKIPMFMKFRQVCKFSWFYNPENEDAHQKERLHNIENDIFFTGCKIDKTLFKNKK